MTKNGKKIVKKITKGKKRGIKIASTIVIPTTEQDSTNSAFYRILRKGYWGLACPENRSQLLVY